MMRDARRWPRRTTDRTISVSVLLAGPTCECRRFLSRVRRSVCTLPAHRYFTMDSERKRRARFGDGKFVNTWRVLLALLGAERLRGNEIMTRRFSFPIGLFTYEGTSGVTCRCVCLFK
jgi:hypothetical protein